MWSKISYYITYYFVYTWMYLHALLPFRLLYVLSDILYLLVYYVVGYRRKIVKKNLKNSFPDKSDKELKKIEKDFYHSFCDYIVETLKLLHISDEEMSKRMVFKNIDLVKDLTKDGNSCLMYLGHYCNWEWVTSITLMFDEKTQLAQIYKPLSNKALDKIFFDLRKRFGSVGIAKNDTLRKIVEMKRSGTQTVIGFMADQTPTKNSIHYWSKFLNQETPLFTGVERIAKQTGFVVTYLDIEKVARGKYVCEVKLISSKSKDEPEFVITERYIREFEKTIQRNPAYWLWTHNRWKYKKEDFQA